MFSVDWSPLRRFVTRPRRRVAAVVALAFVAGLVEATVLVLVVRIGLLVTGSSSASTLPFVDLELSMASMIAFGVALASANIGLHFLNARRIAGLAVEVAVGARDEAIGAFLSATWQRQAQERESILHDTVNVQAPNVSQLVLHSVSGVVAALQVVTLLVIAVAVDPAASAIVFVVGGLLFAALRPMVNATRRRSRGLVEAQTTLAAELGRAASMAMELRVFGVTDRVRASLGSTNAGVGRRNRALRTAGRFADSLYRDLAMLFLVVALGVVHLVGASDAAGIGAVMLLVVRAANGAQALQVVRQAVGELQPSLEAFDTRVGSLVDACEATGTRRVHELGAVELVDVVYSYSGGEPALRGVSLTIGRGEVVGIVGPSGGGKSTLVQVLTRLRHPDTGVVTAAGRSIADIHPADWSRMVTLVPQEPHLMDGTVRDNIRFMRDDIDDAAIEVAARRAHIWDELHQMPDGIDTVLGNRGLGLSGGQRQRVALARALARAPQLLVLDEPTSALDPESEQRLLETLLELKGSMAVVIVTHRPVPLSACDRVVEMRDGVLVS